MRRTSKSTFSVLCLLLIGLFHASTARSSPTHFKSDLDFGGGTVFTTFLDLTVGDGQFSITSPRNADVRIMGSKARLGRMLGKSPKKGIIMTIAGTERSDSLFGETKIPMIGKLRFRGAVTNNVLSGEFLNSDSVPIGTLRGAATTAYKIEYKQLHSKLLKTVQDNIYSASVVQTRDWARFGKRVEKLCNEAHDDVELYFGFNILTQKLPFTHLTMLIAQDAPEDEEPVRTTKSVVFEEKSSVTAYLQIRNFSTSKDELAEILPKIVGNPAYKNLIIDLRDNGGGGIDAAFELAKYIVTDDMEVGYFPTNKLAYSGYQPGLFSTLPELQPRSTQEFGEELRQSPGARLIFRKPTNPVFTGNLYVLTNGMTGSTCEPMVYALKNRKKATIIGEKTYGGMLAASPFVVSGKYMLMLPVADFYTYDGVRLDKVGVSPDIEVKSDKALNKALDVISAGSRPD